MRIGVGEPHCDPSCGLANQAHLQGVVIGISLRDVFVERTVVIVRTRQKRNHTSGEGRVGAEKAARQIPDGRNAWAATCERHRPRIKRRSWTRSCWPPGCGLTSRATKTYRSAGERRVQIFLHD